MKARFAVVMAVCVLVPVLSPARASAQTGTVPKTGATAAKIEPYKAEEFPSWALDLRRADIVAFGALPFTVFFAQFAIDGWRFSQNSLAPEVRGRH